MRNFDHRLKAACSLLVYALGFGFVTEPARGGDDDPAAAGAASQPAPLTTIAVVEGGKPTSRDVAGSYGKDTLGVEGGIIKGSGTGNPSVEIGGIRVGTSAPILMLPGAIAGGIYGKAQEELQEFRDALADDLAAATERPLTSYLLALHVYQNLRNLPGVEPRLFGASAPLPDNMDTVLYVSLRDVTIDVVDDDAILKTTAEIELKQRSRGALPDRLWFYYQDKDTLTNWTQNDNALWHDYANFAGHYLGREIAADVLTGVKLRNELRPANSATISTRRDDEWRGSSETRTPFLAWDLTLPGQDPQYAWADELDESDIDFDLEIYDRHRLVYARERIPEPAHRLEAALDACQSYWWSVRPVYHIGGQVKYGEWMRMRPDADSIGDRSIVGREASAAPAYIQDFASLHVDCRAS